MEEILERIDMPEYELISYAEKLEIDAAIERFFISRNMPCMGNDWLGEGNPVFRYKRHFVSNEGDQA